jgi:hypothetical protein
MPAQPVNEADVNRRIRTVIPLLDPNERSRCGDIRRYHWWLFNEHLVRDMVLDGRQRANTRARNGYITGCGAGCGLSLLLVAATESCFEFLHGALTILQQLYTLLGSNGLSEMRSVV